MNKKITVKFFYLIYGMNEKNASQKATEFKDTIKHGL